MALWMLQDQLLEFKEMLKVHSLDCQCFGQVKGFALYIAATQLSQNCKISTNANTHFPTCNLSVINFNENIIPC